MDGYINEGGQLKSKNGQKYIINDSRGGFFVTKTCAILCAIFGILAVIGAILITYFLATNGADTTSCSTGVSNENSVAHASIFGVASNGKNNDIPDPSTEISIKTTEITTTTTTLLPPTVQYKLEQYEGWNPILYTLLIEPNLKKMKCNGSVTIKMVRDTSYDGIHPIVLDINNITVHDVSVSKITLANESLPMQISHKYGSNNNTYVITIDSDLGVHQMTEEPTVVDVKLDFTSDVTDTLQGVYKASYLNIETASTKWMVSTQFSPIDARRAFPCIDRPDKKANFSITIVREANKSMALSNMPAISKTVSRPGYVEEKFQTTPKMPTYLVAFIISDLVKSNVTDNDNNTTPIINIWTRPETSSMTKYAYTLTRKVLPFFEDYFGIKYQLPKIDLVSVPDFGFGAMENWGLITFRDSSILVPEDEEVTSSAGHTEHVASVICHELAHQWFGNLVTPKVWDDLWLKEGFATFLGYLAIDHTNPHWHVLEAFTIYEFQQSMEKDSDLSSHAISFNVSTSADIRRIFDPISYSKGAILVRMIRSMIGNEAFQKGLQEFLTAHAYGNVDREVLWKTMTKYGHELETLPKDMTLNAIINTWIHQPGYPMISVKRDGSDIVVTQERYLVSNKNKSDDSMWFVPITFETSHIKRGDDIPNHWLTNNDRELRIPNVFTSQDSTDVAVYLNLNRQGYYRVNYDYKSWLEIHKQFNNLNSVIRAQIVDDALHLARAEYITYDIPITLLLELRSSPKDHLFWISAQQGLSYLINMLQREPTYELFRAFMRYIVRPAFDHYGLEEPEGESHIQLAHRSRVAHLACKFNYDRCTIAAQKMYRQWIGHPAENLIKPNLKGTIYCTALSEGSFHEWYFAYNQYQKTTSASEKEQILTAMGCTPKPWLLSKYLNMTLDPKSGILKQDGARAFGAVASNPIGFEIAFDFLSTNIKEISEYFGDGFSTVSKMITSITSYMNRDYHKKLLEIFAEKAGSLGLIAIQNAVKLAMKTVDNNIYWREHSYNNITQVLEILIDDMRINLY